LRDFLFYTVSLTTTTDVDFAFPFIFLGGFGGLGGGGGGGGGATSSPESPSCGGGGGGGGGGGAGAPTAGGSGGGGGAACFFDCAINCADITPAIARRMIFFFIYNGFAGKIPSADVSIKKSPARGRRPEVGFGKQLM
jgi:hypothetical protein